MLSPTLRSLLAGTLIFLISCTSPAKAPPPDCGKLKTGKFEYRNYLGEGFISIERNDSTQFEHLDNIGLGMKFRIDWSSDCDYVLTFLSFTGKEEFVVPEEGFPVTRTKIIKVTPNYYIAESTAGDDRTIRKDTILINN
jgi:hypothetical protein